MLDCRQNLRKHKLALQVRETTPVADPTEQLSSASILHHQIEPLERLHHLIQTHYVGVSQLLHATDFRGKKCLRLLVQTHLIQDFYCHSLYQDKTDMGEGGESKRNKHILPFYIAISCCELFISFYILILTILVHSSSCPYT